MIPLALHARLIFPVDQPPIENGFVEICDGRISTVGAERPSCEVIELGNVAVLPGLVNPHTHLEFSDLERPLGTPGIPFPDWIRQVIAHRQKLSNTSNDAVGALRKGLSESLAAGVTTLGEIATSAAWRETTDRCPLDMVIFRELLGLRSERKESATELAQAHCQLFAEEKSLGDAGHDSRDVPHGTKSPGLSPHSPYSVHPRVIQRAMRLSRERQFPLAMHLAESREELRLLQSQDGPLFELLQELEAWEAGLIPAGSRPLDYLIMVAPAHRTLIVHGNYLDDEELGFLASRADKMSLVYCPRTHAYFGHDEYPLAKALERGVTVAVGTDSRATNPDLNMLSELRFVALQHPQVTRATILKLGTINAAKALGTEQRVGSLSPGKAANLAIIKLPNREAADPYELLFNSDEPVVATYIHGARVTM